MIATNKEHKLGLLQDIILHRLQDIIFIYLCKWNATTIFSQPKQTDCVIFSFE